MKQGAKENFIFTHISLASALKVESNIFDLYKFDLLK